MSNGHRVVSDTGVTIIRQTVNAVASESWNISVNAAGGNKGLNGTLPRRVTSRPLTRRRYAHFDDPLTDVALKTFTVQGDNIASHAFLPLIGYQKVVRKMDFSVFPPLAKNKERDIRYASHTDSAIYSIYAQALSEAYEQQIKLKGVGDCILAYRGGIGYNVPFAKSLIDEVRARGCCHVTCLDVSGFFDNLDHKLLKAMLCRLLGTTRLPADWYKIYRRLTAFEYVLREDIEARLGKIKGQRICQISTFHSAIRPIIRTNTSSRGIPQGTPLSGLLANIYMFDLDCRAHEYFVKLGGSYRRYSDDIAVVVPDPKEEAAALSFLQTLLEEHHLSFNPSKTCRTTFTAAANRQYYSGEILQYLGFTYDGEKILIRPESIKNFYARMKSNIRGYIKAAAKKGVPLAELRRRVLIGRFTHWGDSRNFVQYAYRAARELKAPEIRRQLRNHVPIFDRQWAKMVAKYGP
jgi:hypothetical protein